MDEKWIQIALELGATKAVILPIEQVVTGQLGRPSSIYSSTRSLTSCR